MLSAKVAVPSVRDVRFHLCNLLEMSKVTKVESRFRCKAGGTLGRERFRVVTVAGVTRIYGTHVVTCHGAHAHTHTRARDTGET